MSQILKLANKFVVKYAIDSRGALTFLASIIKAADKLLEECNKDPIAKILCKEISNFKYLTINCYNDLYKDGLKIADFNLLNKLGTNICSKLDSLEIDDEEFKLMKANCDKITSDLNLVKSKFENGTSLPGLNAGKPKQTAPKEPYRPFQGRTDDPVEDSWKEDEAKRGYYPPRPLVPEREDGGSAAGKKKLE